MLQHSQDFLAHTLAHPQALPCSESFALSDGTRVSLPHVGVLRFEPESPLGQDIVLSAGVHGNETAPIEVLNLLVADLLSGRLNCRSRLLILFGNPPAMVKGLREIRINMNRLFSGAHGNGEAEEQQRAALLENQVRDFFAAGREGNRRYHYDLHTAIRDSKREKFAIYPFRHGAPWKWQQIEFLASCGVDTILLSHSATTTFSYFSSNEFGADAFTVELGKVKPFGDNDLGRLDDLRHQLAALVQGDDLNLERVSRDEITVFDVAQTINKSTEDFSFTFADNAANFTPFPRGHLLATDGDIEHRVAAVEEAIVFPNARVALSQRACLTVVPVGPEQPFC